MGRGLQGRWESAPFGIFIIHPISGFSLFVILYFLKKHRVAVRCVQVGQEVPHLEGTRSDFEVKSNYIFGMIEK